VKKDTVYVPPRGHVVLRFKADNEGIWMFHCHILWHQAAGMVMAFQVMGNEHGVFTDDPQRRERSGQFCRF
jgi:FtsP/CotA-like multicopper oxidase with cupredoxin domain